MQIDGKLIAHELRGALQARFEEQRNKLSLGIIVVKETPAIKQFVSYKQQFAKEVKVNVEILQLGMFGQKNEDLLQLIFHATKNHDGLILQLPVPFEFNVASALSIFPMFHDVDVLGDTAFQQFKEGNLPFLPPVVGAFDEILKRNNIRLSEKNVLVIGEGRLVGGPAAIWAERMLGKVTVANKETENLLELTKNADVIITGTGVPGLIQPDMIRDGVILLDAGSGEMAGKILGDADPACAEKAYLFTPTPGGVGPITVAKVFENLIALHNMKNR